MFFEGYAQFGCTTVWNGAQTEAFIANLGIQRISACHGCDDLEALTADEGPWTTPDGADGGTAAPWHDADTPSSQFFAGFVPTEVIGDESSPVTQGFTEALTGGAILHRARVGVRTITVRGWLAAATGCAAAYGMRWLSAAMTNPCGNLDCGDCAGQTLSGFDCCPGSPETVCLAGDADPVDIDDPLDVDDFTARHLRCLRGVAVVEGPTVLQKLGAGCDCHNIPALWEVEFVLIATTPWYYRQPVEDVLTGDVPDTDDCADVWCTDSNCRCICPDPEPCAGDPNCQVTPPPRLEVSGGCVCVPLATVSECHNVPIPATGLPDWGEVLPIVTIVTGDVPLRGVTLQWHENPHGIACADAVQECGLCPGLLIGYIPANSELVLDATNRTALLDCDGIPQSHAASLAGTDGGPPEWPVLACNDTEPCLCIGLDALANEADHGATFSIDLIVREL